MHQITCAELGRDASGVLRTAVSTGVPTPVVQDDRPIAFIVSSTQVEALETFGRLTKLIDGDDTVRFEEGSLSPALERFVEDIIDTRAAEHGRQSLKEDGGVALEEFAKDMGVEI